MRSDVAGFSDKTALEKVKAELGGEEMTWETVRKSF
jgi:hypothetical protein